MATIQRRKSVTVSVGGVRVGGDVPVVVQSMTNTDTADVQGTIQQVAALARAGSELVRVTVNNDAAAKAVPHIDRKSTRLNSSHRCISYAVFCLKKKSGSCLPDALRSVTPCLL